MPWKVNLFAALELLQQVDGNGLFILCPALSIQEHCQASRESH